MMYGTEKSIFAIDDKGSTITNIAKYRNGDTEKVIKHYRIRVKVYSPQDEMAEFIRFIDELSRCRKNRTLTYDKEDATTKPAFILEYPKEDLDGSYFIIKNYCIVDIH